MPSRHVTDTGGRIWECAQVDSREKRLQTQDVRIQCSSVTVSSPVVLTVGWEWMKMPEYLLARLITNVSPMPDQTPDRLQAHRTAVPASKGRIQ